jgi:hypothetical protein
MHEEQNPMENVVDAMKKEPKQPKNVGNDEITIIIIGDRTYQLIS